MTRFALIASSFLLLATAFFGWSTRSKIHDLKADYAAAESKVVSAEKKMVDAQSDLKSAEEKLTEATEKAVTADAALAGRTKELETVKANIAALQTSIAEKDKQIAELTTAGGTGTDGTSASGEQLTVLQQEVEDAKAKLAELTQVNQALEAKASSAQSQAAELQAEKKRREQAIMAKGLEGQVLAVDRNWDFIVISIGDRQGVVANAEMVVRRGNEMVGKVRIHSVERSQSVANIIPGTTGRDGIRPGDIVVYPGA